MTDDPGPRLDVLRTAGDGVVALHPRQAARTRMAFAKYGLHEDGYIPGRWEPCSCGDFNAAIRPGLSVYSTFTDPEREMFTVWGEPDGRHPLAASIVVMPRGNGCYHLRYVEAPDDELMQGRRHP